MIGPQAYENLFLTMQEANLKACSYTLNGIRYTYTYDWEIISMFQSVEGFEQWCLEDIMERQGEYADKKELIE